MSAGIRLDKATESPRYTRRWFGVTKVCLAVVTVLPMRSAWAGEANEADYTEMSLDQLMAIPVTTASKREQKQRRRRRR